MASAFKYLFFCTALAVVLVAASGVQFQVGEKIGWRKPTGREHETYNEWAGKNRSRVGDALYFTYKDSVLEVSAADYLTCNTVESHLQFDDGSTVFQLDRPGSMVSRVNARVKSRTSDPSPNLIENILSKVAFYEDLFRLMAQDSRD